MGVLAEGWEVSAQKSARKVHAHRKLLDQQEPPTGHHEQSGEPPIYASSALWALVKHLVDRDGDLKEGMQSH
jgi:hypothetical protein